MELADVPDSKSGGLIPRAGSTPATGTRKYPAADCSAAGFDFALYPILFCVGCGSVEILESEQVSISLDGGLFGSVEESFGSVGECAGK